MLCNYPSIHSRQHLDKGKEDSEYFSLVMRRLTGLDT
jgi:hypothetical protein